MDCVVDCPDGSLRHIAAVEIKSHAHFKEDTLYWQNPDRGRALDRATS
jgi:hypothetical protein